LESIKEFFSAGKTKIQYASDLHLEFNSEYVKNNPLKVTGDILILAGDISIFNTDSNTKDPFWDWASENYKEVIVAFGNHEFYSGKDLATMTDGYELEIKSNVHYYYNKVVTIGDIDIIVSTLWTKIENNKDFIETKVSDYRKILYNEKFVTVSEINQEHEKCLQFIKKSLNESQAKHKIVVTHYVPSEELVNEKFKNSPYHDAFSVDLTDFIKNCNADYWIYGHSHINDKKVVIGKTKCICNQLGYIFRMEHKFFDAGKYFTV